MATGPKAGLYQNAQSASYFLPTLVAVIFGSALHKTIIENPFKRDDLRAINFSYSGMRKVQRSLLSAKSKK